MSQKFSVLYNILSLQNLIQAKYTLIQCYCLQELLVLKAVSHYAGNGHYFFLHHCLRMPSILLCSFFFFFFTMKYVIIDQVQKS